MNSKKNKTAHGRRQEAIQRINVISHINVFNLYYPDSTLGIALCPAQSAYFRQLKKQPIPVRMWQNGFGRVKKVSRFKMYLIRGPGKQPGQVHGNQLKARADLWFQTGSQVH